MGCGYLGIYGVYVGVTWCTGQPYVDPVIITSYAVVTPLRKAASYEPRIAILGIWGDTWLTPRKGPVTTTYCHVDAVFATILATYHPKSPTWLYVAHCFQCLS